MNLDINLIEPPFDNNTTERELRDSLFELQQKAEVIYKSLNLFKIAKSTPIGKYLFGENKKGRVFDYCSITLDSNEGTIDVHEEGNGAHDYNTGTFNPRYPLNELIIELTKGLMRIAVSDDNTSEKFKYMKGDFRFTFETNSKGCSLDISTELNPRVLDERRHQLIGILLDIKSIEERLKSMDKDDKVISTDFWKKD